MQKRFLFSVLLLVCYNSVCAHGDLHERIKEVTHAIKNHPDSAYLYFKRGVLYSQHQEYKKSIKDFGKSKRLGYHKVQLNYQVARAHYHLQHFNEALDETDKIIARSPQHVKSLRLKGRILQSMKRYEEAASSFSKVIKYAEKTVPENFLEASLAYEACQSKHCECLSIDVILEGIDHLGNLRIFYDRLVMLSKSANDLPSAIHYQTLIINQSDRKERGYFDRAQLHALNGNTAQTRKDLKAAQTSIEGLRARQRSIESVRSLSESIEVQLNLIKTN